MKAGKGLHTFLILAVAVLAAAFCAYAAASDSEARRKARYYYSAGALEQARGNEAAAYEYFKRAYEIDPSYEETSYSYGSRRLMIGTDTMQSDRELKRSLEMMREFVDRFPDDEYESLYYGYACGQLDTLEEATRVLERVYARRPESTSTLLQISDAYARNGDLPGAIDALSRYEAVEGKYPSVTLRKISFLLASQDTVGAAEEVDRLVSSDPASATFRIMKGNFYDIVGKPDSSIVYYKQAEALDPESGAAKLALAGYYHEHGDSVAYDNKIYEALLTEDFDLEQKVGLLADYLQKLMTDKHETKRGDYLFSVLHNQYPHEPRVLDLAARFSMAKQNYGDAIEQISYAIDRDPTNKVYWGQLMTYQMVADHPLETLETYERAKAHITPDDNIKLIYTNAASLAKRYDLSIAMFHDMIHEILPEQNPDSLISLRSIRPDITLEELDRLGTLFTMMGDVYHLDKQHEASYRAYDNAITLDPSNAMAKNNYAYFLSTNGGNLNKAEQLSKEVLDGPEGDNPTYIDTFAWIQFLKNDFDKAEEYQKRAVEESDKLEYPSAEIYDHYGDILIKKGDRAGAARAWKRALNIQEENKETAEDSYKETLKKFEKVADAYVAEPVVKPEENADAAPSDGSDSSVSAIPAAVEKVKE